MTITEAAYLAGIIDGEGSIMLSRTSSLGENGYTTRLTIANTSLLLLQAVVRMTGTGAIIGRREQERRRTGYTWVCPVADQRLLLESIAPFLILKKEHALLSLEYTGLRDEAKRAKKKGVLPEAKARRREIYERMRDLNRRGTEALPQDTEVDRIATRPYESRHKTTEEEEQQVLEMLLAGELTAMRIAEAVGVDRTVVRRIARENGIETPYLSAERHWLNRRAMTGEGLRSAVCETCGTAFETTHHKQKFCSLACQEKADVRRRTEARRAELGLNEERPCQLCGEKFLPARTNSRFCSRKCTMKDWRLNKDQQQ